MENNPKEPRGYDAVLGGQNQIPVGSVVLGGMEGVKRRWDSAAIEPRIAALKDAINYGQPGLNIVINALHDESEQVRRVAYLLLRDRRETEVYRALQDFVHYKLFDCIKTVKAGTNIAISPEGDAIAFLRGKTIRAIDTDSEQLLYTIPKYPRAQELFALSDRGQLLVRVRNSPRATGSGAIEIFQQGELRHTLHGHSAHIGAIAISPDDATLASGSEDKTIKRWDIKKGKLICTFGDSLTWGAHTQAVYCLVFSASGQTLISSGRDGKIKIWNLKTGERPQNLKAHSNYLAIAPDRQILASTSWDGKIRLWNLSSRQILRTLEGHLYGGVGAIAFSGDGQILATGGHDGIVKLWNVKTGEEIYALTGHNQSISCLTFSWGDRTLISGSLDKTVKVWGVD